MSEVVAIDRAIRAFASLPLEPAGRGLLEALGYRSAKTIALDGRPATFAREVDHDSQLSRDTAFFDKWQEVRFLFQLTNDEIPMLGRPQGGLGTAERFGRSIVDSFVFLAIQLEGEVWKRSKLVGITRAVNALFPMPVIILFRYGSRVSLAASERRQHKRDASRDVQTGRISIVLNISTVRPHRGHLSILAKLDPQAMRPRPSNFDELYAGWQAALSTKTLNETFYKELSHWFFWARDLVTFPEGAVRLENGKPKYEVPLIRLLTRVIFCWFIKERGLVPENLFRREQLKSLLKIDPGAVLEEGNYYRAVLQNLFFATLNTEMGEGRKWRSKNAGGGQDGHYMVHSVYRYRDLFAEPDAALELFQKVPFLNGGLFECLDRELTERDLERDPGLMKISDGKRLRVDGFSDHPKNPLHIPNRIFFGDAVEVDLNAVYETAGKSYTARGLFTLFDDYVFTVEENTSVEEEVALDPELLGKVFENLLASYNPETSSSARKMSGSFYTPRYVVDYMVRETLVHQFAAGLTELDSDRFARARALLDPTAPVPEFSEDERDTLIAAIEDLKVLDPACGSGAFPMGMLQALMEALRRLDPDNRKWKAALRAPLERRVADAHNYDITRREMETEEAEAALRTFDEEFADKELADYVRKLHLIEKCLYGSDIQPIAILIAKLRFFISLAVEQKQHKGRANLGIKPLPNLETKLVAANSLIPLERPEQGDLFANPRIGELERAIEDATQRHFSARTITTKRKYRDLIQHYRDELSAILETEHSLPHEDARKAAAWNPFDQNASAPFFDPLWMFQLHGGFDIVIGNPPYVRHEKIKDQKPALEKVYGRKDRKGQQLGSYAGTADYLVYFVERGIRLLSPGGTFSYITSNKWYRAGYGENLRHWFTVNAKIETLIDFGDADVFDAIAYPTILVASRRLHPGPKPEDRFRALNWQDFGEGAQIEDFPALVESAGFDMPQSALEKDRWQIEPTAKRDLLARIRSAGVPLGDYVESRFYYGIKTGYNEAFVIDGAKRAELISADPASAEVIKPFLRGRDIKRWKVQPQDLWLIFTRHGIDIDDYPAVKQHLAQYRDALEPKPRDWKSADWPGRKSGPYKWYEIQDNIAYWREFETTKIVYPDIYEHQSFAWDESGAYGANTCYFIPTTERWMTAVLNSSLIEWYYRQVSNAIRGGYLRAFSEVMQSVPIARVTEAQRTVVDALVAVLSAEQRPAVEQLLNGLVYELYFPDDLHARRLKLFDAAADAGLGALAGLKGETLIRAAEAFARQHLAPTQPLRVMLSDLQTLDVVRTVEGKK
ncbi:Eco57I restriction-modification methylase domain-containing protein [Mesorhizobium sp. ES1-3]|uniref:Eco57I restriction-modification methylase domain-containing protein n=1 Tax=Mesorhizobium sp. ES1-3 TaxID=2876628 RepID=UPI001CCC167A|nr:TaqI-like C-terminal specificity domain-containing protein [Mesorhizobium sp. ES1-3]MBZ9673787.1 Eco57I restriction-modification methylase domain-containing protein [Mesorhizobium sp. ES1-3]